MAGDSQTQLWEGGPYPGPCVREHFPTTQSQRNLFSWNKVRHRYSLASQRLGPLTVERKHRQIMLSKSVVGDKLERLSRSCNCLRGPDYAIPPTQLLSQRGGGPKFPFDHSKRRKGRYLAGGRLLISAQYAWTLGLVHRVGVWPKPDQSQLPWNFSPWSLEGNILSQKLTSLRCEPRRWVQAKTRKGGSPEAIRDPDSTSHRSSNCPVSCLPKLGCAALLFNQLPFCLN